MGKSFDYQDNLRKLENLEFSLFDRKMNRREFLYIGLAIGSILGGIGLWRFLLPKRKEEETTTSSPTPTPTETTTTTTSPTPTQTITETPTLYPPRLSKANFTKTYSSKGLNVLVWLEFDKKSSIKNAKLSFPIFGPLLVPLSKVEENVYRGECLIERPKPVDYKAVWDAETKDGIKASEMIPEEERTLKMKMPLEDYDPSWKKEKLDELFSISILSYPKDPEKIFLTAYQLANKTGRRPKRSESLQALANYSIALEQGLPFIEGHELLLDACEKNPEIVDFSSINVGGQAIQSKNIPRDTWMIANLLKERPQIVNEPKKFEWINRMVQQVAWCIFDDDKYGVNSEWIEVWTGKIHKPENLKPSDDSVWQVILPFYDYMDSLPSRLEKNGIEIPIPYHDSALLKSSIADKVNRTLALFYLFDLPSSTIDKEFARKYIEEYKAKGGKGYPKDLVEKSVRMGIEGMKVFVEQLPTEYEEIVKLYPNGKVQFLGIKSPRFFYYYWLDDRWHHGLSNTVAQFVGGWDDSKVQHGENITFDWIENQNGIDQFLTKNWKSWDLVKFIYGYERFRSVEWGGEWQMYTYGLPLAFKAFGIPSGAEPGTFPGIIISHDPYLTEAGAPGDEWAVTLPDDVIKQLKEAFPNYQIVTDYANRISLFSLVDGLVKDSSGVKWTGMVVRNKNIYLWKK